MHGLTGADKNRPLQNLEQKHIPLGMQCFTIDRILIEITVSWTMTLLLSSGECMRTHTGDLLFGIIDTEYRNQITVIGSTVNFASRLQGEAKKDNIVISAETKQKVQNIFTFHEEDHGEKLMSIL